MAYYTPVSYKWFDTSAQFTRQNNTTAYAVGQVVGTVAAGYQTYTVTDSSGQGFLLNDVMVSSSVKQTVTPFFKLWLTDAPFTSNGDATALSISTTEVVGKWLVVPVNEVSGATATTYAAASGLNHYFRPAATDNKVYGVLVADNAYTPAASEVFTVHLRGLML